MAQHLFTSITYYNNIIPIILYGGYTKSNPYYSPTKEYFVRTVLYTYT